MTSEIRVNKLENRVGLGTIEYSNTGPVISGVTTASNFKTGSSNLHSTGLTVGNTFVHSTGVNVFNSRELVDELYTKPAPSVTVLISMLPPCVLSSLETNSIADS